MIKTSIGLNAANVVATIASTDSRLENVDLQGKSFAARRFDALSGARDDDNTVLDAEVAGSFWNLRVFNRL